MKLVPDKLMNSVPPGESINKIVLVFPYSLDEFGGDPCMQGAAWTTREDVDSWLTSHDDAIVVDAGTVGMALWVSSLGLVIPAKA